jgi:hypothetical protein
MNQQPTDREIVLADGPPPAGALSPLVREPVPRTEVGLERCPTTLDLTTHEGRAMAIRAMQPADQNVAELEGGRFSLLHVLIHWSEWEDAETGELCHGPRVVLIDPAGRTLQTKGVAMPGVIREVARLWPGRLGVTPLPITILERKSRKMGRTYHTLRVLPDGE